MKDNKLWKAISLVKAIHQEENDKQLCIRVKKLMKNLHDEDVSLSVIEEEIKRGLKFDNSGFISDNVNKDEGVPNMGIFSTSHMTFLLDSREGKGFAKKDVEALSNTTNNIIREISPMHSKKRHIKKMGLVFGQVQSGKTTHYSMLINKAFDNGFKNIIVLTSDSVKLNVQTHNSIEEHVTGKGPKGNIIGVGNFQDQDIYKNKVSVLSEKDGITNSTVTEMWDKFENRIIIARKNSNILTTLLSVLRNYKIDTDNEPWILIDDEADYASIDTTPRDDDKKRTSINAYINTVVHDIIKKVAYIGYTATPFANLLMKENRAVSLRPQFMQYIAPGRGYNGVKKYFIDHNMQEVIEATHDWKSSDDYIKKYLLRQAILSFSVDSAFKKISVNKEKFVMTINVAHTKEEHKYIKNTILEIFIDLNNEYKENNLSIMQDILGIIDKNYGGHSNKMMIAQASQNFLKDLILNNKIYVQNSEEDEVPVGDAIIMIGGFKFSRGLTIDDLTFFYIDRTSKNYDTILQQARWFGYRKVNPTLFIPEEYYKVFQRASLATMELINQIGIHDDTLESFYPKLKVYKKLSPTSMAKSGKREYYLGAGSSYRGLRKKADKVIFDQKIIDSNNNKLSEFVHSLIDSGEYEVTKSSGNINSEKGYLLIRAVELERIISILRQVNYLDLSNLFISQMEESVKEFKNKKFTISIPSGVGKDNTWLKGFNLKMQTKDEGETNISESMNKRMIKTSGTGKRTDYKSDNAGRVVTNQRDELEESLMVIYTSQFKNGYVNFVALELSGGDKDNPLKKIDHFYFDGTPIEKII